MERALIYSSKIGNDACIIAYFSKKSMILGFFLKNVLDILDLVVPAANH